MIRERYDYTLELTCDKCGKHCTWKNQGEYPHNNMKGNRIQAIADDWFIKKYSCKCPKCRKGGIKEQ